MKIGVMYGSSRPSNKGELVAKWFTDVVEAGDDVEFEMIDLAEVNLPMFNEKMPPIANQYEHEHSKQWSTRVQELDGVIMVAAEYNHGPTPILKNAIDYLYHEWSDLPVAFISYGAAPHSDSVIMLQKIMGHVQAKVVQETMHITPAHEAVTDDGVDESKVVGDPKLVLSKLVELV